MRRIVHLFGIAMMGIALTGCPPKAQVKKQEKPPELEKVEAKPEVVPEPTLRGKEYQSVPELATVHFAFDSSELEAEARAILQKNAEYLRGHEVEVVIEGHCDERGTIEYNLALGQRRANAVRQYYMNLGVSGERIATRSYGKEKPLCPESTEECWAKNRRVETLARIPPSKS